MKNVLVDMLKAQGFTAAQSMEFACEHTLLSKKYVALLAEGVDRNPLPPDG